jgi:tRNA (cmo5U34)-methyltransferase
VGAIVGAIGDYHFTPDEYLESVVGEIPGYDELQARTAAATAGLEASSILELGVGTGETAVRVLDLHPDARLVGIDASVEMLARARTVLPDAELHVSRLEEPLPQGPFDLVVSALAVHHLDRVGKRDLFARVRAALAAGGVFVLADVVVPKRPEDALTPLTPGFDLPDTAEAQRAWLDEAGFAAQLLWEHGDLAVLRAKRLY